MAEHPKKASTRRLKVGTRRIPRPPGRPGPPAGEGPVELVSGEEEESSLVRRRVHGGYVPKGLSLRWRILIAIAGVTVITGLLIFIVVYNNAVDHLNDEINAKGERLVNTLASVDGEYWMTAIHRGDDRRKAHISFLRRLAPEVDPNRYGAELEALYEPAGPDRREHVRGVITKIVGKPDWFEKKVKGDSTLSAEFERIVAPFGLIDEMDPLSSLKEGNPDLVQLAVVDVSRGDSSPPAVVGGILGVGLSTVENLPKRKEGERVTVSEETLKVGGRYTRVRIFVRNPEPKAKHELRYVATLSLQKISDAKGSLFWAIFLTVLVAIAGGSGIAIWISSLITKPVKVLMRDIQIVSEGDLEHETASTSGDEIGLLAATFNKMTGALKIAREQELEQKRMEHQLAVAREIQENLMPKRVLKIPGYDVGAFYRPSQEVGGDYYDFIEIDEEHAGIIVADVSGKGVPGAIVMSMALAFLREEVDRTRNTSPMATLIRANNMLAQNIKKGMFVTALYLILNKRTNELRVTSAGHNPLIIWDAAHNRIKLVNPKGIALGFDKGPVFERTIEEGSVSLHRGDRVVAYTDGTVEAMNAAKEEFGDKRFYQVVQQLATRDSNQFLNLLVHKLDEHKGEAPQHDDITIVTFRYL